MMTEVARLSHQIAEEYEIAWSEAYDRRRSSFAVIGAGHSYEDDGAPSNSLLVDAANQESRRDGLGVAAGKLDQALGLLRSAQGLIDPSHKPSTSQWTPAELRRTEARFQDAKRGHGAKTR